MTFSNTSSCGEVAVQGVGRRACWLGLDKDRFLSVNPAHILVLTQCWESLKPEEQRSNVSVFIYSAVTETLDAAYFGDQKYVACVHLTDIFKAYRICLYFVISSRRGWIQGVSPTLRCSLKS